MAVLLLVKDESGLHRQNGGLLSSGPLPRVFAMKSGISVGKRLKLAEVLWGWKPFPAQAAVLLDTAQNKTVVCGRRWGKTESGAIDDLTCMLLEDGWTSMVVAPSRDQVMINYKEAKDRLESCPEFRGSWRCRETPHPEIMWGDRGLMYRTSGDNGKYIRGHGKKVRRIRVDEAAYVKQDVIDGVIEPMCLDMGAQMILQGTPFGKNHFFQRYREGVAGDPKYDGSASFHFPTETNPHLDRPSYERIRTRLGSDSLQWRCEYLAEFVDSASCVFPWDLIESCFYDVCKYDGKVREYGTYIAGIDLARYSDYTVVVVAGFDRGQVSICDMDRFNEIDWTAQKARIYDMVQRYGAVGAIDATGEGDAVVDDLIMGEFEGNEDGNVRARKGLVLEKVRITSNQIKRDLIDKLRVRMAQGLVKIPYSSMDANGVENWRLMADELKYYSYTLTESGKVTFAADRGYHDDIVMALALLVKRAFGNFEVRSASSAYPPETFGWVCEQFDRMAAQEGRVIIGHG